MTGILLSIILALGMSGGPTDFNDGCGIDETVAVSQEAN